MDTADSVTMLNSYMSHFWIRSWHRTVPTLMGPSFQRPDLGDQRSQDHMTLSLRCYFLGAPCPFSIPGTLPKKHIDQTATFINKPKLALVFYHPIGCLPVRLFCSLLDFLFQHRVHF